jgi:hypothetical protein
MPLSTPFLTALLAGGFAAIHLFIGRLKLLDVVPRSRGLSFAGGVAVAYVFLHIMPELAEHQETFAEGLELGESAAEILVYAVALLGLAAFYGLERAVKAERGRRKRESRGESAVFWLHIGSFGLYNVLIGYLLLHRQEQGVGPLIVYFIAMGLHFVTNDFGLRQDHKEVYDRRGRWIIAAAVLLGWALGLVVALHETAVGFLFAFLGGGIVLNVLKEELPEERESRFFPFAGGVIGYAALLTVIGLIG